MQCFVKCTCKAEKQDKAEKIQITLYQRTIFAERLCTVLFWGDSLHLQFVLLCTTLQAHKGSCTSTPAFSNGFSDKISYSIQATDVTKHCCICQLMISLAGCLRDSSTGTYKWGTWKGKRKERKCHRCTNVLRKWKSNELFPCWDLKR